MKIRYAITMAIATALLLPTGALAADAAPTAKAASAPAVATDAKDKKKDKAKAKAAPEAGKHAAKSEALCDYVAGSRIRRAPPVQCENATSGQHNISADELSSTGELNTADALRKLDPRLQ